MGYRSLDTISSWLRLALVACAGTYLMDARRLPDALHSYASTEEAVGGGWRLSGSGGPDPLHDWQLIAVIAVVLLLALFFERAYRNVCPLGLPGGVLWSGRGRRWRVTTAAWAGLVALACVSIAAGDQLHAGTRTIDDAQLRDPIEAAGELITAGAALMTAVVVSVISFRQARRAAELGLPG